MADDYARCFGLQQPVALGGIALQTTSSPLLQSVACFHRSYAMKRPTDLKFTETHEWVRVEGNVATVGITDYAVTQLSDLVYMEMPKVGTTLQQGKPFTEIESVKAVAEFFAPVSGTIIEVNEKLETSLETITRSPYAEGWVVRIEMSDPSELEKLMDLSAYEKFLEKASMEH